MNKRIYEKDNLGEQFGDTEEWEEGPVTLSDKKLPDIFKMNLVIPDYQRIYCWEEKNVYQLWIDIVELKGDKPYHLGAVILHRKGGEYHIVDGQQRLVTLTLVLQLLGPESGETDSVGCPLPLLDQKFESSDACNYVAYNKYLLTNYIAKYKGDKNTLKKNILELLVFSVLVLSDESLDLAYTFFSNQNSKGIPLSDYNLLKAHHLRYIQTEEQAKHLAGKWDSLLLPENAEADLARTLGMYLFRLRKWMRKTNWDEFARFRVKNEFEAALVMTEIPPFGEKFEFYEKIQGGAHFFAYTEHFVYWYKMFTKTPHFRELEKGLDAESHWYYKDVIGTLLFGYYLKFSEMYLTEALVCIEQLISRHRYANKRALLYKVLEYAGASEVVMMIDQATSPTFFLAEIVDILKRSELPGELTPVQKRYYDRLKQIYRNLNGIGVCCQNKEIKSLVDDEYGR